MVKNQTVLAFANLNHSPGVVFRRAKDVWVWDTDGNKYLDGMAGMWYAALGYGHPELVEAARTQLETLSCGHVFNGRSNEPAEQLAEKLRELSPAPTARVLFGTSGSDANDAQVKLAWYYNNALGKPERKKIIAHQGGYHGSTIVAASLTGFSRVHRDFDLPFGERFVHVACPHFYRGVEAGESEEDFATRLANELEEAILREGPETIAAFIAEPVMGGGGLFVPPRTYFAKVQAILRRYDIAFIADEVICGFHRTGELFGSHTYGIEPDSVTVAKQLTAGYAPLSAVTISPEMWEVLQAQSDKIGAFAHGFTFQGHPLSCAIALKALEIYEREDISAHVQQVSRLFQERLQALASHSLVGNARGVGLLGGIELVADKASKEPFPAEQQVPARVVRACEKEGLLLRASGDVITICPPLIITSEQIELLFERLEEALNQVAKEVQK